MDGTLSLCKDLGVKPEDVVLLAVAYELNLRASADGGRQVSFTVLACERGCRIML